MSKRVCVLGAGLVAGPLVRYLLAVPDVELVLADQDADKVEGLLCGHPRGRGLPLNIDDEAALSTVLGGVDLVVSLLPFTLHLKVAHLCLELGKSLITASYVKPEMEALDSAFKAKGLIFLNEMGVDPGLDHMAAMRVIDRVKARGGKITSFFSYCGGLPAPASNNLPLGYKFSWSPSGVMLAAKNDGCYLLNGETVEVPQEQLFQHYWFQEVPGAGVFEAYVNRDARPYKAIYSIPEAESVYRGTLRNTGHCESWDLFKKLGLLETEPVFDSRALSPRQVLAGLINSDGRNLIRDLSRFLDVPEHAVTLKKLEWLGFLSNEPLEFDRPTPFDCFGRLLLDRLSYQPDETDMIVQHHEFAAGYPEGGRERITSTLVQEGEPGGESAMSRTVGLPAGIGARLILEGKVTATGVIRPVIQEIYDPVLDELEGLGIGFQESRG